ncbi:Hsp70 family protein [Botrimarina hoheduenensis]|uniref:Chaperone protein HscC n=1 Tax=Botrimarina hoheduenensis TaxID=2528000 RepID=A0A5C5VS57_9BACT|nr:Hsp70 family protein [Botrimarina hoheduenensis]TWT41434.1 Chaperone protein HscC [Botrimarina hoheduenensis]
MRPILGIDLGTTNSLCAVFRNGKPELVPNVHGDAMTPSVVGVLPSGAILVGAAAKELAVTQPDRVVSCFKRWMGSSHQVELGGLSFSAVELSSMVLKSLHQDALNLLQGEADEAVVTVPAYFNDHQRSATKVAAEMAGLRVRRILNEPTAAALAYGFHEPDAERRLLVIDLGGGTFDVTLMEVFEGTLEILSTAGESQLGGEDFTSRLLSEVLKTQNLQLETAELKTPLYVSRLRVECERAKRTLGTDLEASIRLPDEAGTFPDGGKRVRVSEKAFAKACTPLIERIVKPIERVLRDKELRTGDIDEVILVGGATRMPLLKKLVYEVFSREALMKHDPDQVVALGAAIQAALITDDRAVEDMVMTDVCPFTLGVDTAKHFGSQLQAGYYSPIIHRNTTIPVSREEAYATTHANQTVMHVDIYQGESRRVEKNVKLGELTVTGIPLGPAGQTVYIRFTYDLNGILEVEAYAAGAEDRKVSTIIAQQTAGLGAAEIAAAKERMKALKYYPREDQELQRLLRGAEAFVGEVSPFQREGLEAAIDAFEAALADSNRAAVESARETLLHVLTSLGYPEL